MAFAAFSATAAFADECPVQFAARRPPAILNHKLDAKTQTLCFEAYAALHSGLTRTSLWSAEHLTARSVSEARGNERVNQFHAESRLPAGERAELSDYVRSGYDRGHLAPSGDMPTSKAQAESFSLANMTPQSPKLNRGLWEEIESAVRDQAVREGELYVVTGPLFQGGEVKLLNGHVLVPTGYFKAVWSPSRNMAAAYVVDNRDDSDYNIISISELSRLAGLDVFPGVSDGVKRNAGKLPVPTTSRYKQASVGARETAAARKRLSSIIRF